MERIYLENVNALYNYAYCIVKDWELARDLTEDTFLEAIKKSDQLQAHENPKGWLWEALKRNIKQYLRRQMRTYSVITSLSISEDELPAQAGVGKNGEMLLLLIRDVLSEDDYRLFVLYYLRDYTHEQLAKEFGISVAASQKRLERIRKRLRRVLTEK